jgi:hypothetical protein
MILGATNDEVKFVRKQIRLDFHRRYDEAVLRQTFFEQQNCLCILCGQTMEGWEGVFSHIEHMIPLRLFAEFYVSGWSLEQVLDNANGLKNLRLSHIACGGRKQDYDLEEIPENFFDSVQVENLTAEEIQQYEEWLSERGRKGGRIAGRKAAESGHMERMLNLPQTKKAQSENIDRVRNLPQTRAAQSKNGHIIGQIYGHIAGRIGGRITNDAAHRLNPKYRETRAAAGRSSSSRHVRWHINRAIVKRSCRFCEGVQAVNSNAVAAWGE